MKARDIPRNITTWMSWVDREATSYDCNTNPYLATFIMYMFLLMGAVRAATYTVEVFESLDDVYVLMVPQDQGLGILCLILCAAESVMLCGGIPDMIIRFLIVVVLVNVFYMIGLFLPMLAQAMLVIVAIAYLCRLIGIFVSYKK